MLWKKKFLFYSAAKDKKLEIIERADHMFLKEGHLNKVLKLAGDWFTKYLR